MSRPLSLRAPRWHRDAQATRQSACASPRLRHLLEAPRPPIPSPDTVRTTRGARAFTRSGTRAPRRRRWRCVLGQAWKPSIPPPHTLALARSRMRRGQTPGNSATAVARFKRITTHPHCNNAHARTWENFSLRQPFVRRGNAATSWVVGRLRSERPPEGLSGNLDVFFTHPLALARPAHELREDSPHHALVNPRAPLWEGPLPLAMSEHLQHLRARPPVMLPRRVRVWMGVEEGEAHEVGLQQRPGRQLAPEGEEDVAKPLPQRVAVRHLVGDETGIGQVALGEGPYRPRDALLAAVVAVQRAHREPRGTGQLRGPHVVQTPLGQQLRRVTQPGFAQLRQRVHPPSPVHPCATTPSVTFVRR
ncbi:hypothetical protein MYMAC_006160 [Corallococcus macrosporus DSM 14697]|uniref:Uncharacterized protein n=1 Tax=Corallococcus macrosporus DSM 14697 TaxID=1189310 RepID=A0A250K336_9BACT|nr:hypothetical protein MYMAC_006160 [Corallococcus macrosporus DSM 14697]